ncbi:hypothetical protein [Xanthomonas sp. MUS 060]|uniref:hypothetical protein n=1 Tax=Xanthomonas sp. MUS 060 TaxID=1588031 RepID=UPI001F4315E9|nr:hypothetical protein [Xanthomonas sp. MUS 060]
MAPQRGGRGWTDPLPRSGTGNRAAYLPIFPPDWMLLHAGMPPRSGDKDILSTYLQFTAKPA